MHNASEICTGVGCRGVPWEHRRFGGAQPGNRFVSFVHAYARSGSEVGIGEN